MDAVNPSRVFGTPMPWLSLEEIADYLRANGYHVVPRDRVRKLRMGASLDRRYIDDATFDYAQYWRSAIARNLAHEITNSDAVLWGDREDFMRIYRTADVCLITPKEPDELERQAERPSPVQGDHA